MIRVPLALTLGLLAAVLTAQTPAGVELTSCAEIRSLPPAIAAEGRPVRVSGVVTLVPADAPGHFMVDDGAGIWVAPARGRLDQTPTQLAVGDLVEIEGRTHEGHFAPTIALHAVKIVGRSALPATRFIAAFGMEAGRYDCQRVAARGVVQSAEVQQKGGRPALNLLVSTPTGQFNYVLYDQFATPPPQLVDAEIEVAGVFLSYFNSRREFLGVRILSNDPRELRITLAPEADAFAAPLLPLGEAMGFSSRGMDLHRRRVQGTITLCKPGHFFYLQDRQNALRVNTRQADALVPGDVVEATGFFSLEHHRAEMQDAVFRKTGRAPPTSAERITRQQAFVREPRAMYSVPQDYDDYLVALRGRLVSVDHKQGEPVRVNFESDGVLVPAELTGTQDARFLDSLRLGSELLVSGICSISFSRSRPVVDWPTPVALRLLLRGPSDIQVVAAASWWTPQRLWTALAATALVLFGALGWVALLRRQVARRGSELAEMIRARRDAAIEFETTLRERNRLAADLHDTTEQSLTGLAFQLEATEALHGRAPDRSQQHLALARQLLGRSREDLRRSIWNLRANPLERNTLGEALREVAADRSAGTATRILVECRGTERPLPDFVAGNLLLFAQEAITNALKHAAPGEIELRLNFAPHSLALAIHDDGSGFDPAHVDGPKDGHFGLQGMRERIKRLDGRFEIRSAPGHGTLVTADIPG